MLKVKTPGLGVFDDVTDKDCFAIYMHYFVAEMRRPVGYSTLVFVGRRQCRQCTIIISVTRNRSVKFVTYN